MDRLRTLLQNESALITSPPARVPMAHQTERATESLMNFTEPSAKPTLTPPGWLLVAVTAPPMPPQPVSERPKAEFPTHVMEFGVIQWR